VLVIVNYTLEQFIVCSTAEFSKRMQVWRNKVAVLAASYECFQSLLVGGASKPQQALEAYDSLAITTERLIVCNATSSMP